MEFIAIFSRESQSMKDIRAMQRNPDKTKTIFSEMKEKKQS